MKEKIYTIPINDAFDLNCECAVCEFIKKEEESRIEYTLGASMMEPDFRIETNKKGFCQRHSQMLYDFGNRLSYALVLESRLDYLQNELSKIEKNIKKHAPKKISIGKTKLKDEVTKSEKNFSETVNSCAVCDRLNKVLIDFTDNIFYLYKTDDEFKTKFFKSKGFCIQHFNLLLNRAVLQLNDIELSEFSEKLVKSEKENIERIKEDVSWFTKKFDYRYKDEDWKNSRDAVERGCEKTSMYMK